MDQFMQQRARPSIYKFQLIEIIGCSFLQTNFWYFSYLKNTYKYIYYFYIYVYVRNHEISDVPSRLLPHGFGHMRPKGISYHKTIVVVIDKAHCFHDFVYCILFFCRFGHLVSLKIKKTNFNFFEGINFREWAMKGIFSTC